MGKLTSPPETPAGRRPGGRPESRVEELEQLAREAQSEELAREARSLAERLSAGRYYVACVGQFKRGKSSLLNALVGVDVLPTGVLPVTSAITILRHGPDLSASVRYNDGRTESIDPGEVARYVSETANPGNEKRVRSVEISSPCELLSEGMCLVDTPGLGSVSDANSGVTEGFVPHVDAALVVLGADPPISGQELALVERVAAGVRDLIFVLNKADRVPAADLDEATRFTAALLSRRLRRPIGRPLLVSTLERQREGSTRDWGTLEERMAALARHSGADLVRAAERRGVERLARALLHELQEREDALVKPMAEVEQRLRTLRRSVAAGEQVLADLGVLLAGEQARLARDFRERQEKFFPRAQRAAAGELAAAVTELDVPRRKLRAAALERAREVAHAAVERFREEIEPVGEALYRRSVARFVELANATLQDLRASGGAELQALPTAIEPDGGLRVRSELYYTQMMHLTMSPGGWLLDPLRSRAAAARAVLRFATPYLESLVEANSSRVANDMVERVTRSRERLESDLRQALGQITSAAERAVTRALELRSQGEAAEHAELARIAALRERVRPFVKEVPSHSGLATEAGREAELLAPKVAVDGSQP